MNGSSTLDNWEFVQTSREDGKKLRLLYELIDCGNNKRVLTEADKLLKKQPDFTCAKVFKALALIRQKNEDDARELLEPISHQVQTDDAVLQALSFCYEELDEPASLCRVLEAACKKKPSKGLLTQCFMAQIRTDKYNKQYLTALSLYKTYNDPTYFEWAMASLLTEAVRSKDESARGISLLLSERMLIKFIDEEIVQKGGQLEENLLFLFLETLFKQGKWEEVLKVMKEHCGLPQPSNWMCNFHYEVYTEALFQLGRRKELFDYLKQCFLLNLDEYQLIQRIINVFKGDQEEKEWVKSLMEELRSNKSKSSYVVALADLLFQYASPQEDQKWVERVREDLKITCALGAEKPSFPSDIGSYITSELLSMELKLEFLEWLSLSPPKLGSKGGGDKEALQKYESIGKIVRDVNYELIQRQLFPDATPLLRMERAHRCLQKYLMGEATASSLRSGSESKPDSSNSKENLLTKEADFHDQFLVIAASTLLAKYDDHDEAKTCHFFEGVLDEVKSSSPDWVCGAKAKRKLQNGIENGIDIEKLSIQEDSAGYNLHVHDTEYLLTTAILLMEFGLQRCPFNHSLRILLIKAYCRIGAVKKALKIANGLDIKHVQWDSLGYLIMWKTLQSGAYYEARYIFDTAETIYSEYKKEGMDNVLAAFKYGKFCMILTFLRFRDMLLNSTQNGLIKVEKRLQEFCWANPSQIVGVAKRTYQALQFDDGEGIFNFDNRDFTVLQCGVEGDPSILDKLKEATGKIEGVVLNARNVLLVLITEVVLAAEDEGIGDDNLLARIEQGINRFKGNMEDLMRKIAEYDEHVPPFDGLWPPSQLRYCELGCVTVLVELLGGVAEVVGNQEVLGGGGDTATAPLVEMGKAVNAFWTKLKEILMKNIKNLSLLTMKKFLEDFHFVLETLKFSSVLFHVCLKLIKKKKRALDRISGGALRSSTRKKKKGTGTASEASSLENFIAESKQHFEILREAFSSLRDEVLGEIFKTSLLRSKGFEWETEAEKKWQGLISDQFRDQVFSPLWNQVQFGIVESFRDQLGEFVVGINTSLKFIESVSNEH